jgi:hypothetical protein
MHARPVDLSFFTCPFAQHFADSQGQLAPCDGQRKKIVAVKAVKATQKSRSAHPLDPNHDERRTRIGTAIAKRSRSTSFSSTSPRTELILPFWRDCFRDGDDGVEPFFSLVGYWPGLKRRKWRETTAPRLLVMDHDGHAPRTRGAKY